MARKTIVETVSEHITPLDITTWHRKTFPDAALIGQKNKLKEEKKEWEQSHDIAELADIYIVACGLLRYDCADAMMAFHYIEEQCMLESILHSQLLKAVDKKMNINYNRNRKATSDGAYHHI